MNTFLIRSSGIEIKADNSTFPPLNFSLQAVQNQEILDKVIFEKESIVNHEHKKGAIQTMYTPFQIKTIAYKNQILFVWENITDLDLQFLHALWLPYHLITSIIRGDFAFIKGFFSAFFLLPKIIQSSFKAQKNFIKTDKEILSRFSE